MLYEDTVSILVKFQNAASKQPQMTVPPARALGCFRKQQSRHCRGWGVKPYLPCDGLSMASVLSHENLENRTFLMVPKLYLWFSDSVVWMQCAHCGSHTWNFDLLISTLKYSIRAMLAPEAACQLCDCKGNRLHCAAEWWPIVTVIVLLLCVINTYICNHLCICVCERLHVGHSDFQLCSSEVLHLDFWLKSSPLNLGACCFNEPSVCRCHHLKWQLTVGSCWVSVEVSGPYDCTVRTTQWATSTVLFSSSDEMGIV